MKLTLTTNEGLVLGHWDIEEEFGDLEKPFPRAALVEEVVVPWRRERACEKIREMMETKPPHNG